MPADLNRTTWHDWYGAAENEGKRLLGEYKNVFAAGLSMGGLLSLHAGSQLQGIKGIISINPPVFTQYLILSVMSPVVKGVIPYFTKGFRKEDELAAQGRFDYKCYPVQAYTSLRKLRETVLNELAEIKLPVLIIQSLKDKAVRKGSAEYIKEQLVNSRAKLVTLPNSGHIATMGDEKHLLVQKIVDFMENESN